MLEKYYPYKYADSVFEIDYGRLYETGCRAVIFDIDNTLVHHGDDSTPEIDGLLKKISGIGLKTLLLSNNSEERVRSFIKNIDTLYIANADKPQAKNYLKAVELLGVDKSEAVYVGDQIFIDIIGANRAGIASILVKFIRLDSEKRIGKKRYIEKIILWFYKRNKKLFNRI